MRSLAKGDGDLWCVDGNEFVMNIEDRVRLTVNSGTGQLRMNNVDIYLPWVRQRQLRNAARSRMVKRALDASGIRCK